MVPCGSLLVPQCEFDSEMGHCAEWCLRRITAERRDTLVGQIHSLRMVASRNGFFAPRLGIRKATLTFVAKFFWLLVRNRVSPTKADNQVTWDRAVMVAALVAGVEIDFAHLCGEIHERAFRTSTTYPFPCLIFQLCRDSGVPIWHCDRLVHPTGALDIGLIRDEANVAAPRREPQVEVPPLGTDLAADGASAGDDGAPIHRKCRAPLLAASMGPS
ncbi:hypothetical protein H5410_046526 [Solanum commersonii]|uniref:Putative plant transposon protein domain-containing protein n=1 Tax=Solanum commersonii TaxID=4109 RepID=A0A9J5XFR7_SOLCO|nr:hypothetical protein H5410_046526 [Solanum commersonii]